MTKSNPNEFDGLGNIVDNGTNTTTISHIYRTNYDGNLKQHKCLEWGSWCWQNVREHPLDVIKYLKKVLK